ncbi:tripartite-type tricarboxylate transporter receptor subunit TctC [Pseudorhodoferax soli]|uniref:Tripartite-type tricarboxylate transporter receptor subunit TctC n=1 Tax=Pseudorhodoferax soli TaxID=545864 RepID=A0A368XUM2_9BURK|nr:tripartite-type tricarboxylate transporter receptor subunit TctC [Pseudorhodoferax soli]
MRTFSRRGLLALPLAGLLGAAPWLPAHAQTGFPIPGKPIRIVVPFSAGAGSDNTARLIARMFSEELGGQPVVVDNKPGAGTFIGASEVARAPADGHTLLYTIVVTHTQNPHLYSKLPYDPVKDFTPLTQVMKSATVLTAPINAPYNSVRELVAYAKANPGKLNFASFALGSTSHLNGELLKMRAGIDMVHVPYKGTADASQALMAGDVQLYFDGTATAVQAIKSGKAKGLGAASRHACRRCPMCPPWSSRAFRAWTSWAGRASSAPATWRRPRRRRSRPSSPRSCAAPRCSGSSRPRATSPPARPAPISRPSCSATPSAGAK